MVHGDDRGLCLPPRIAPIEVMLIPINTKNEDVMEKISSIYDSLKNNFKCKLDTSSKSAGWKFNEYDMKGVPVRL